LFWPIQQKEMSSQKGKKEKETTCLLIFYLFIKTTMIIKDDN